MEGPVFVKPLAPLKRPKLHRQNAVLEPPQKKQKTEAPEPSKKVVPPYFFQNGCPVYKIA